MWQSGRAGKAGSLAADTLRTRCQARADAHASGRADKRMGGRARGKKTCAAEGGEGEGGAAEAVNAAPVKATLVKAVKVAIGEGSEGRVKAETVKRRRW